MLSQKLFRNCQVKRRQFQFPPITSNLSKSAIIYHSFHQNIQTFKGPPVPMFLFKHKVQSIQNTQQTVMRSAIPLHLLQSHTECRSSGFIVLKSKTYQINVLSHLRYQNPVIQTRLLPSTLGGTRKLKTGHMEFSPVSASKTRQHKQTSRTNRPENCLCCGEDHGITRSCCGEDHGITTPPPNSDS